MFTDWFKIRFSYRGEEFEFVIDCNHLDTNDENWFWRIGLRVGDEYYDADVFGSIVDGELTTDYPFGVDVYLNDDDIDTIEDVEILCGE